jgi:SAM-dependent methyltransferase
VNTVAGKKLHVPELLRRGAERREDATMDEAEWLIDHMCMHLGLANLGESEVLDFGCGVKFTQALINRSLPIRRYVGVDVEPDVINYLEAHVDDPRFEYHHLDAHNELYNPDGVPLSAEMAMSIEGQAFDVICLFSVFTHLAPHDYRAMLQLLHRFAKPTARLFYTLFINELTDNGRGLVDSLASKAGAALTSPVVEPDDSPVPDFVDMNPSDPLRWAVYSRQYALALVDGTGWHVESVSPPDIHLQHHIVCRPEARSQT